MVATITSDSITISTISTVRTESLCSAGASVARLKNLCPKSGAVFGAESAPGDSSPALLGVLA